MKCVFLRSALLGGIALAILPVWVWANGEVPAPTPVIRTSTGEDSVEKQQQRQLAIKAQEKKDAMEEVNALIVDSYKALLDKILGQLYANIAEASKGDRSVQILTLSKVRDNLDQKLDALDEQNITPNRKKILQGVYFYLKSNVELRIQSLQK